MVISLQVLHAVDMFELCAEDEAMYIFAAHTCEISDMLMLVITCVSRKYAKDSVWSIRHVGDDI